MLSEILLTDDFLSTSPTSRKKTHQKRPSITTRKSGSGGSVLPLTAAKQKSDSGSPSMRHVEDGPSPNESDRDPLLSSISENDPSRYSGSPRGAGGSERGEDDEDEDVEELAKKDPLATQVWKMYARTKAQLPHAQRMENLTWRMMALALRKKKKEEEEQLLMKDKGKEEEKARQEVKPEMFLSDEAVESPGELGEQSSTTQGEKSPGSSLEDVATEDERRGRAPGKGKGKMTIVGFGAGDDDDDDDAE